MAPDFVIALAWTPELIAGLSEQTPYLARVLH
jgi:hypothetical protein